MALTLWPDTYETFVRPLLFKLPPERAQHLADQSLKLWPFWQALGSVTNFRSSKLETSLTGIDLANPIGLAAGYDKNCAVLPALTSLGFGYVTCGTVTLDPRPGNPGVRLLRDSSNLALVNALGFPGDGLEAAVEQIIKAKGRISGAPVVVSISGTEIDDIVACHRRLEPLVDAIEVNISSPNTAGLRLFHDVDVLGSLIEAINEDRSKPLFVKMPPFPRREDDPEHHDLVLALAKTCAGRAAEALTVANTQPVQDARLGIGSGGLSGRPILGQMIRMVSEVRERVGDQTAINACGGIFTASDAWMALAAGADTVQLLTSFVYRGPGVARDISKGLANIVERHGLDSIRDISSVVDSN